MKKLLVALCLTCALVLAAHAGDEGEKKAESKSKSPTAEQKALRKTIREKYDTNKDGKLDAAEKAAVPQEEWDKAGYAPRKEKKEKKAE